MRVIAKKTLQEFWKQAPDAKGSLEAWYPEARHAQWKSPSDIEARYAHASIINNERVVFNICGNKYRLVVAISFTAAIVLVKFVGTHADYDKINVETV
jgi:mRNA interferase HigB